MKEFASLTFRFPTWYGGNSLGGSVITGLAIRWDGFDTEAGFWIQVSRAVAVETR